MKSIIQVIINIVALMITIVLLYNFGIGLDEVYSLAQFSEEGNLLYVWLLFGINIILIFINSFTIIKKVIIILRGKVNN